MTTNTNSIKLIPFYWERLKSTNFLKNHPLAIAAAVLLVLFFLTLTSYVAFGAQTYGASDSRIVHVSINGEVRVVPTRAETVGELIGRLEDIALHEKDIVEPALHTEITADNFKVNIYKARPVLVVDEDRQVMTVTAEPRPEKIVEAAGLPEVHPEDKIEKEIPEVVEPAELIKEGIIAEKVVIERATPTHINLYGNPIAVRTHATTVAEVLEEKNIKPLADDVITPALGSELTENIQIFITRVGSQIETTEEEIPMPVETVDDPTMLPGQRVVRQEGRPGRKLVTYEIRLENGQEAARKPIQEVVSVKPRTHVVAVGTRVVYSNPSSNVQLGQQIAAEMGWAGEFSCIYQLFQKESGWNHLARNRSSGAYGIPQALPGSKMGPGWETDPAVQIRWGIGYMVNRYGSPCQAFNFWQINGWY